MNRPVTHDNYCIRPDYLPNWNSRTVDQDGSCFWTPRRLNDNLKYQWDVYRYVQAQVVKHGLKRVLDIGCGPAIKLMSQIAPLAHVTGIDQPSTIEYCKSKYTAGEFVADDFENPEYATTTAFDLVVCSDVIEHVQDPDKLLLYIKSFCNPESLVVLSTPARERLRGENASTCTKREHVREWSSSEFASYLESRGFQIVDRRFLPPVKVEMSMLCLMHVAVQWGRGRPFSFNQLVVCRT